MLCSKHTIYVRHDTQVCGADLSSLCAIWSDLSPDYLVYGSLLLLIAQTMFLGG